MKSTTTQQKSLLEIDDQISIMEEIKKDLTRRMDNSTNKIHILYLKEKIQGLNTELRILYTIRTGFIKTIRQKNPRLI